MATDTATLTDRPTGETTSRSGRDALAELVATVAEEISFPTADLPTPDGEYLVSSTACRKILEARNGRDRILLESRSLVSGWTVFHQLPDGTQERISPTNIDRERAYEIAEVYAAELADVDERCRTGRASQ